MDAHNTFDQPDTVTPADTNVELSQGRLVLQLPAKSVTVISVEP